MNYKIFLKKVAKNFVDFEKLCKIVKLKTQKLKERLSATDIEK